MSLMLNEIREQPQVLEGILDDPPKSLARLRKRYSTSRPTMIVVVARGTSDNAALFARYLFEITLGIPTMLAAPSISTLYRRQSLPPDALVIGISQSGESTDINAYLEFASDVGTPTVGITNEDGSTLSKLAEVVLPTRAGTESSVAATKTYTAQLMMLYFLAQVLGSEIPDYALREIPASVQEQLDRESEIQQLAQHYRRISHAVVIGRGFNYANSLEFALKLMETSYVVAAAFSGADFAHGPIAMVDEGFPVFVFTPSGPTSQETGKLLARLAARRVDTIGIGSSPVLDAFPCSHRIELSGSAPRAGGFPADMLTPIRSIVPAQLFAAYLASSKGLDPDHPRMLTKVTRTM